VLVPVRLDRAALRNQGDALPPTLRELVTAGPARAADDAAFLAADSDAAHTDGASGLAGRLAHLPETERASALLAEVRGVVAAVLGIDAGGEVPPDRAFKDLGFDSLLSVELRNRLGTLTGVVLPTSLAFDYPTAGELAHFLGERLELGLGAAGDGEEDRIRELLDGIPISRLRESGLLDLLLDLAQGASEDPRDPWAQDIDAMDAADLLRLAAGAAIDDEEGSLTP
jgi:acyl carrier protein